MFFARILPTAGLALSLCVACVGKEGLPELPCGWDIGRWGPSDSVEYGRGPDSSWTEGGDTEGGDEGPELPQPRYAPPDGMEVIAIDVGQGDSILVRFPQGSTMLVDGGTKSAGETAVVPYLEALHLAKLDYLVASHPDADHVGGLYHVVRAVEVGRLWENGESSDTNAWSDFSDAVDAAGIPRTKVRRGDLEPVDGCLISVLSADQGEDSSNDNSVVLMVDCEGIRVLLTGDIASGMQEELVGEFGEGLRSDVVKVPHHGSWDTFAGFPDHVLPQTAVCSVGKWNGYGHPDPDVVKQWEDTGAAFFRTDEDGHVVVKAKAGVTTVDTQY